MADLPTICVVTNGSNSAGEYLYKAFSKLGYPSRVLGYKEFDREYPQRGVHYICTDDGRNVNSIPDPYEILYRAGSSMLSVWITNRNTLLDIQRTQKCLPSHWMFISDYAGFYSTKILNKVTNCSWLPLAAGFFDKEQTKLDKAFDVVSIADDLVFAELELLRLARFTVQCPVYYFGGQWHEAMLNDFRRSRLGIVAQHQFLMYEMLACGLPILVHEDLDPERLFGYPLPTFVRAYSTQTMTQTIGQYLRDPAFLYSGIVAREWIKSFGTFELRASMILDSLSTSIPSKKMKSFVEKRIKN